MSATDMVVAGLCILVFAGWLRVMFLGDEIKALSEALKEERQTRALSDDNIRTSVNRVDDRISREHENSANIHAKSLKVFEAMSSALTELGDALGYERMPARESWVKVDKEEQS